MLIAVAMLIAISQPYKAQFAVYNKVDTVFILLLALWYCGVLCYELAALKDHRYKFTSVLVTVVVGIAPLLYITAITLYWMCSQSKIGRNIIKKIERWFHHQPSLHLQSANEEDLFANLEQYFEH